MKLFCCLQTVTDLRTLTQTPGTKQLKQWSAAPLQLHLRLRLSSMCVRFLSCK